MEPPAAAKLTDLYDAKAWSATAEQNSSCGSDRLPLHFRAPYRYAELILRSAHRQGCRTILDLCCGIGLHSVRAAEMGYVVTGVDLSAESIKHAKWLAQTRGMAARCEFLVGDAFSTIDSDRRFDVLLVSGSLYYLNWHVFRQFLGTHLRPGGHLLCVETNGTSPLAAGVRRLRAPFRRDRDSWSINRLLGEATIQRIAEGMQRIELRGFDLFTPLGAVVARWKTPAAAYDRLACKLDEVVLGHRLLRRVAFKLVLHATAPECVS